MTSSPTKIHRCRICQNERLSPVLSLGDMVLTGVFPKTAREKISKGPLELVKCEEDESGDSCGLLQLAHNYNPNDMYGQNYGYRSGLNNSMVMHLEKLVQEIQERIALQKRDLVVDIGSNDGTLLSFYPENGPNCIGIDPSGEKFARYYPKHCKLIPDFFSKEVFEKHFGKNKLAYGQTLSMLFLNHPNFLLIANF